MRLPPLPRRRPRRFDEAVKDARLKKYEELLKGYGAHLDNVDDASGENRIEVDFTGELTVSARQDFAQSARQLMTPTSEDAEHGRILSHDGGSRFLDKYVLTLYIPNLRSINDCL
jgi:hypothetical protein